VDSSLVLSWCNGRATGLSDPQIRQMTCLGGRLLKQTMHVHLAVDSASGERETLGAGGGDSTAWTREAVAVSVRVGQGAEREALGGGGRKTCEGLAQGGVTVTVKLGSASNRHVTILFFQIGFLLDLLSKSRDQRGRWLSGDCLR
jgi:hypothetical protein